MFSGLSSREESQGGLYSVVPSRHGPSTWRLPCSGTPTETLSSRGVPIGSGSDVLQGPGVDICPLDSSFPTPPLGTSVFKAGLLFLKETVVRGDLTDGRGQTLDWTASVISREWLGQSGVSGQSDTDMCLVTAGQFT